MAQTAQVQALVDAGDRPTMPPKPDDRFGSEMVRLLRAAVHKAAVDHRDVLHQPWVRAKKAGDVKAQAEKSRTGQLLYATIWPYFEFHSSSCMRQMTYAHTPRGASRCYFRHWKHTSTIFEMRGKHFKFLTSYF